MATLVENIQSTIVGLKSIFKSIGGDKTSPEYSESLHGKLGTFKNAQGEDSTAGEEIAKISQELGKIGTPKSGATYTTLFGAIEANQGGGGGGGIIVPYIGIGDGSEVIEPVPTAFEAALLGGKNFKKIYSTIDKIVTNAATYKNTSVERIEFPNVTSIPNNFLIGAISLAEFISPSVGSIGIYSFEDCTSLCRVDITNIETMGTGLFNRANKIVDLVIGKGFSGNISMVNTKYDPSFAYTYQKELWNSNLREHFAANLTDRSSIVTQGGTAYTITFGTTVLSQFEQATIDAFTNKGWVLA